MSAVKRATSLREIVPALVRQRAPGRHRELALGERGVEAGAGGGRARRRGVWSRAQSQTHAAAATSGSGVTFALNVAQPHDQTPASLNCVATNFAASASSLTISSQAAAGWSPARWPRPGRGRDLHLERDPAGGDPDLGQVVDEAAQALAHREARRGRAELVEADRVRRGEVDLAEQDRDLRDLLPPVGGVAAGVGRVRDREQRRRAEVREVGEELEDVRAVLRVVRRPRRRRLGAGELVLGDRRRLAAGDRDGVVEERLRAVVDQRRVGRVARRADALVEVEVEEDGRRAGGAVSARARRCPRRPRS